MFFEVQGREGQDMSHPLRTRLQRRLEWSVFARFTRDLWLPKWTSKGPTLNIELDQPGSYLIVCGLPPINFGKGQQTTVQLEKILGGIYGDRCSALLLDVESKPEQRPPSFQKPIFQHSNSNSANLALSNRVLDLTTRQEGGNKQLGVKPDEDISTNRLTQKDGHSDSVQVPLRNANRIESILSRAKEHMEGGLPELVLSWSQDQLKELNYDELTLLTKAYSMPLVLVPEERFSSEFGGIIVIDPWDNSRGTLQGDEIHRRFGRYTLPLRYLSDSVVDEIRKKVGLIDWMKADQKFFLLGLATLLPLRAALNKAESLEEIRSVSASFVIIKTEGRVSLDLDRVSIKRY